jgi:hypothetical protein
MAVPVTHAQSWAPPAGSVAVADRSAPQIAAPPAARSWIPLMVQPSLAVRPLPMAERSRRRPMTSEPLGADVELSPTASQSPPMALATERVEPSTLPARRRRHLSGRELTFVAMTALGVSMFVAAGSVWIRRSNAPAPTASKVPTAVSAVPSTTNVPTSVDTVASTQPVLAPVITTVPAAIAPVTAPIESTVETTVPTSGPVRLLCSDVTGIGPVTQTSNGETLLFRIVIRNSADLLITIGAGAGNRARLSTFRDTAVERDCVGSTKTMVAPLGIYQAGIDTESGSASGLIVTTIGPNALTFEPAT